MEIKPYVGVTGLVTEGEVESVLDGFHQAGYSMDSAHIPMLGFLVSQKTLNGLPTQNRRYPKFSDLHSLIKKVGGKGLPMIHYNSRNDDLANQLSKVFDGLYQEGLCRSVQLNILYPDVKQLSLVKESMPDMKIVFQASSSVMGGKSPKEVADSIKPYGQVIDYVLIDPSGGNGKRLDFKRSINIYGEISGMLPGAKIGFAGGLAGKNVGDMVYELRSRIGTSGFCIDAEGGLRDKLSEEYGDDNLNIEKVKDYLKNSASGFNSIRFYN